VRTNVVIAGLFGLWLGTLAEINGLLFADGASMRSFDGWAGAILLLLGVAGLILGNGQKVRG